MKRIAAALMVVGAMVGFGQVADAYPPQPPVVTASDSTPAAGGSFNVTIEGCTDGETVTFSFQGSTQTATCTDGTATASFAAPSNAGTFNGTVQAAGTTSTFTVTVESKPTEQELPATGGGTSTGATTWIAGGLLLAGVGMFAVAETRRRRSRVAA